MLHRRPGGTRIPPFQCQIVLNEKSSRFCPGYRVQGHTLISIQKDWLTKGLIVSISGQTFVNCQEGAKSLQFLYDFKVIFGDVEDCRAKIDPRYNHTRSRGKKMLKAGIHKFPFYFDLEKKDLPMSFSSEYGSIRYQIVVHILGEYQCVPKAEKTILLSVPTISLLNDPSLSRPLIYKAGRQNLKILFKLERKLLLPKQDLSFTLEIYNVSNAKATISLIQKLDFKASLETKTTKRKIWSISNEYFEVFWTDYFKTPESVPPSNFGCDKSKGIIDVNYFIKLEVESNDPDKSRMKAEIPIKIGFPIPKEKQNSSTNRETNEPNTSRYSSPPAIFEPHSKETGPTNRPTTSHTSNSSDISHRVFLGQNMNTEVLAPAYSDLSLYSIADTLPPPYEELYTRRLSF